MRENSRTLRDETHSKRNDADSKESLKNPVKYYCNALVNPTLLLAWRVFVMSDESDPKALFEGTRNSKGLNCSSNDLSGVP